MKVLAIDAPFKPLSLDELFALELPDQDYIVDEILPQGALFLLSAREKAGKGLLAIDLCASVAFGEPFLDRAVLEGAAIYCAAEERIRDVRDRITARIGDRRDAPLLILPLDGSTEDRLQLEDPVGVERLANMIKESQPRLVILDTLRELHSCDEDSADEMAPLLRPLRQIAHQTNTTIGLNHHHNRGGSFRGSTAILASCDLGWSFSRTDGETEDGSIRGTLRVEGRHGPRTVISMKLGEGLRWEPDQPVVPLREPGARQCILTYLGNVDAGQTAVQISEATGIAQKTVQNTLTSLRSETPCMVVAEGEGTKSDPRRFRVRLPELEQDISVTPTEIVPPDSPPYGAPAGGNQIRIIGEPGDDRWTW